MAPTPIDIEPGAPTGLVAVAGNSEVRLTWRAPSQSGSTALRAYEYEHKSGTPQVSSGWIAIPNPSNNPPATSFTVTGLTNATAYTFVVRARNQTLAGATSNSFTITPRAPDVPPGAPTDLTAVAGNSSVRLTWRAPNTTGTSELDSYEFRVVRDNDNTWTDWESTDSKSPALNVSNLDNGIEYAFQVRARNQTLPGTASHTTTATPTATISTAPRALRATPANNQVTLNWSAPSNNGGASITRYEYRYDTHADNTWTGWTNAGNGLSKILTNLTNGTTYAYQVRAVNRHGASVGSNIVSVLIPIPAGAPGVPTAFSATAQNESVSLAWTAPSGNAVSGYQYRRDTNNDDTWSGWYTLGNTTSHTVSSLTNGTLYGFQVRAYNSSGAGGVTSTQTATPKPTQNPPTAPRLSSATGGDRQVTLTWTQPTSQGSSAIIRYDYRYTPGIAYNDASYNTWSNAGTGLSHVVRNLSYRTTYSFQVRAVNSVGGSPASNMLLGTTKQRVLTLPSTPRNFNVASGDGEATLSWKAPTTVGNGITSYEYRYEPNNSGSWTNWEATDNTGDLDNQATTYTHTVDNLANNTEYAFELRARNSDGVSSVSDEQSATPTPTITAPTAPRSLSASVNSTTVTLTWSAPSDNGGETVSYEYRYGSTWYVAGTTTSKKVYNRTVGTTYTFEVRAKNSAGAGPASNRASITIPIPPPPAPSGLSATAGNNSVDLSWTAPVDRLPSNSADDVTDYEYRYDTDNDGSWRHWRSLGSTATADTITQLTNGTTYAFEVRAKNRGGVSDPSNRVTVTLQPDGRVPGAPTSLTASMSGEYVYLSWTAPSDTGTEPIDDYEFQSDTDNDGTWSRWVSTSPDGTGNTNTYVYLSSALPGNTYAYYVRARNSVGTSLASNKVVITIPIATVPDAPASIALVAGDGNITFAWAPPSADGGSTITEYRYRHRSVGGSWSSETSHTYRLRLAQISDLTNNTEYEVEVWALNAIGAGPAIRDTATPTAPSTSTTPSAVENLHADEDNSEVELWWDPPTDDGGSAITDYEYRYRELGSLWSSWISIGQASNEYPEYDVTGLTNGTTYEFQVRAVNSEGAGQIAPTVSATPEPNRPDKVSTINAATGTDPGTVELTWSAPDDNGSPITDYEYAYGIWKDNRWQWVSYDSTGSTSTSLTVTGLESGSTYRFRVKATNAVGTSSSSRYAQTTAR